MVNKQVRQYFIGKEKAEHPITDRLINGGYVQKSGGYIEKAKKARIKDPSQYWHLIYSWCAQSEEDAPFDKRIQCGELLLYMSEVSGAVDATELSELCDRILSGDVHNRKKWNREIQRVCFDRIVETVTKSVA